MKISTKVLQTELTVALANIEVRNYGSAEDIIRQIFSRVKDYNLSKQVCRCGKEFDSCSDCCKRKS